LAVAVQFHVVFSAKSRKQTFAGDEQLLKLAGSSAAIADVPVSEHKGSRGFGQASYNR
jgi:hypothetical protein